MNYFVDRNIAIIRLLIHHIKELINLSLNGILIRLIIFILIPCSERCSASITSFFLLAKQCKYIYYIGTKGSSFLNYVIFVITYGIRFNFLVFFNLFTFLLFTTIMPRNWVFTFSPFPFLLELLSSAVAYDGESKQFKSAQSTLAGINKRLLKISTLIC